MVNNDDQGGHAWTGGHASHHSHHGHAHAHAHVHDAHPPLMQSPDLRSPLESAFGGDCEAKGPAVNSAVAYPQSHSNGFTSRSRSGTASAYGHPGYTPDVAHPRDHLSVVTRFLLNRVQQWPLLHSILAEKDSRRIFYFMRYGCYTRWDLGRRLVAED